MARNFVSRMVILSAASILGCGGEAQLSQSGPSGGSTGGTGGRVVPDSGMESSTSAGGRASAGGSAGTAGNAGSGASAGSSAGTNAGGVGGASGSNGTAGAPTTVTDPNADSRRTLAERYCAACPSVDCVSNWIGHWFLGSSDFCWDELAAAVECSIANNCLPIEGGFVGQGPCLDERNALQNCQVSHFISGTVTGTTTTCNWERSPAGTTCHIGCNENPLRAYGTDCTGPPNGPFTCTCQLNGRNLGDSLVPNGARFFADTCEAAGQRLADGFCHQFINCCYTFSGVYNQGLPEQTLCECTSAPTYGDRYTSCEALASSHPSGKVIELCPGYEPIGVVPTP